MGARAPAARRRCRAAPAPGDTGPSGTDELRCARSQDAIDALVEPHRRAARRRARSRRPTAACRRPGGPAATARRSAARRPGCRTGGAARWPATMTGFHSANVFSTPGSVLVGTNVLAMNVIGKIATNATPCTPSGVLDEAAEQHADPDHRERERDHQPVAGERVERRRSGSASRRRSPVTDMSTIGSSDRIEARDRVAGEDARARDRQRVEAVDRAVRAVVGERDRHAEGSRRRSSGRRSRPSGTPCSCRRRAR